MVMSAFGVEDTRLISKAGKHAAPWGTVRGGANRARALKIGRRGGQAVLRHPIAAGLATAAAGTVGLEAGWRHVKRKYPLPEGYPRPGIDDLEDWPKVSKAYDPNTKKQPHQGRRRVLVGIAGTGAAATGAVGGMAASMAINHKDPYWKTDVKPSAKLLRHTRIGAAGGAVAGAGGLAAYVHHQRRKVSKAGAHRLMAPRAIKRLMVGPGPTREARRAQAANKAMEQTPWYQKLQAENRASTSPQAQRYRTEQDDLWRTQPGR